MAKTTPVFKKTKASWGLFLTWSAQTPSALGGSPDARPLVKDKAPALVGTPHTKQEKFAWNLFWFFLVKHPVWGVLRRVLGFLVSGSAAEA